MREADGFPVGHIILAGIQIEERRPRGAGRKVVVTEDGRRLPHSLLPIELAILGRASLSDGQTGKLREVNPNMLFDELKLEEQKAYRLSYESVNGALKRLNSWGYMSSRVIGRHGGSQQKAYSITLEGLVRIED